MNLLPEWAPNVHPMIVHFPIVLFIVAVLFELAALFLREHNWLRWSAVSVYLFGAVMAIATFLSGREAADSVVLPAMANPVLSEHADLAWITIWYFGIFSVIRLGILIKQFDKKLWLAVILFLAGAGGLNLLFETAEHGAELVYKFGVGVQAVKVEESTIESEEPAASGIVVAKNGSWQWTIDQNIAGNLEKDFSWLQGKAVDLNPVLVNDSEAGSVLSLEFQNDSVMFVAGKLIKSIQADLLLNRDDFQGSVLLVHHVQDAENYDFAGIENNKTILGRVTAGVKNLFDQKSTDAKGLMTLRAVGDGTHFRCYVNEELQTHGHANSLPDGRVGLWIKGSGTLQLKKINVQSLK